MSRRSTPQKKLDEAAFPVRIKVRVPEQGFGRKSDEIYAWLRAKVRLGDYAVHSDGRSFAGDVTAYYFREPEIAVRFVRELGLELADGTELPTYRSPSFPLGRC